MNTTFVQIHVEGEPRPQGSIAMVVRGGRPFPNTSTPGYKAMIEWRKRVESEAILRCPTPHTGVVDIELVFVMPRPGCHYVGGDKDRGWLRDDAPHHHTKRPDLDKLCRAVLDALTGVAFEDDSQVASITAQKVYQDETDQPGVHIDLWLSENCAEEHE